MNNASLLLNAARPQAPSHATSAASASSSSPTASDATTPPNRFDHALDAARAGSRATHADDAHDTHKNTTATASSPHASEQKPAKAASDADKDDATAEKDDNTDKPDDKPAAGDDASLAASVLALIGVPPQVTQIATKGLGLAKDAVTGKAADALTALTGAKGDPADATGAAKAAGLDALTGTATNTAGATAPADGAKVEATPFAALLAGQGGTAGSSKDDGKALDLSAMSPMPLAHGQATHMVGAPTQLQSSQPATSPQFSQELGEQIAWMSSAAGDIKEARIKLHPEELGSMDVRVNVDGGKVNVAIMAQHPAAVHAVQQTLSNLDTLLAHHGLSLGQADVNQGNAQQQGGNQGQGQGGTSAGQAETGADTLVAAATSRVSRGLVDEVA